MRLNKQLLVVASVALLAASVAVGAVFLSTGPEEPVRDQGDGNESQTVTEYEALKAQLEREGIDTLIDTDGDELPDALENFVYGSEPHAFSTTGNGIPDGWFAQFGYDPTLPGVERLPAAVPAEDSLPEVYRGEWPERYQWTLADAHFYGMPADWNEETYFENGIDPREPLATPDGLPTSWLVHHLPDEVFDEDGAIEIIKADLPGQSMTGDGFTVRHNYEHDTDPHLLDTDGDALSDADEVLLYGTDPRQFSTSGTGVPDGWLVEHRLDPLEPMVGSMDSAGKGMNVSDVWEYNLEQFGLQEALEGRGLDPTRMSHRGDRIPDGWLVEHGLDPLEQGIATAQMQCTSDYQRVKYLTPADMPEKLQPIPDLCLSLEDVYLYDRPDGWKEESDGPWPGGLDPASGDQDGDGLPDAVEIRGWYVERTVDVGPGARTEWIHVTSDPRKADTDGDGLTDLDEYHGRAEREGDVFMFPPTDPSNPDTAFSGMSDAEKVFGEFGGESWNLHEEQEDGLLRPVLDPTLRDTAGDHLPDGEVMEFWVQAGINVLDRVPYGGEGGVYPGSLHDDYLDWINALEWLDVEFGSGDLEEAAALLGPDGDVDNDGVVNVVDPSASGDGLLNGWQVNPSTLRFSDFPAPTTSQPRSPTDPANPDTSGDGLPDWWKLQHGGWDDQIGGWDLDPSTWNSNGDGRTNDADANLDGDVVVWHAYQGDRVDVHEWPYTNLLEYRFGTNPRVQDETGSGVSEGWVVFWASGVFYDRWVLDLHSELIDDSDELPFDPGDRIPAEAQILDLRPRIGDPLDPEVGQRVKDEMVYLRFVEEEDETLFGTHIDDEFDEQWVQEPVDTQVIRDGGLESRKIGTIEGTYWHTHAQDQVWGLNPYLMDTVGHGDRDAWGAFYGEQCNIDPADPNMSGADPDLDGLTTLQEYRVGRDQEGDESTNPCEADTDMDGIDDGEEFSLGMDPLDPTDAQFMGAGEQTDSSGDGVPDFEKVQSGLDPLGIDMDRDGLLDGSNRPPSASTTWVDEWSEGFKKTGIAHRDELCGSDSADPRYCFYGERSNSGDPLRHDSIIRGIPDGWAVYWHQTSEDGSPDLRARYACGQPFWWDQAVLGVWWWGLPSVGPGDCPWDRDFDGLHDYNGEDPVPAASQTNRAFDVDLQELMENESIHPRDLVRQAQTWGECAGNPEPCFGEWEGNRDGLSKRQGPVRIEFTSGFGEKALVKEEPFTVSGSLVTACGGNDCPGVPNRSVVLRLGDPEADAEPENPAMLTAYNYQDGRVLGVGFTNEDGAFEITGCLCAGEEEATIPHEGITMLGRSQGNASWAPAAADVEVGSRWSIGVHAYASTPTFWGDGVRDDEDHPQFFDFELGGEGYNATRATWETVAQDVQVTSPTVLTIDLPEELAWDEQGRILRGSVQLNDVSGGAVGGVMVSLSGLRSQSLETTPGGSVDFNIELEPGEVGKRHLHASYAGDEATGWEGASDSASVVLQAPIELGVETERDAVRLGEAFSVTVTVTSLGEPAAGVKLRAGLGETIHRGTTDSKGVARLSLTPSNLPPGPMGVQVTTNVSKWYMSESVSHSVRVVSGSLLHLQGPDEGRLGSALPVEGRLTLPDGEPIRGAAVQFAMAGHELGEAVTDGEGRFKAAPVAPLAVGVGSHPLTAVYAGEADIDEAHREVIVRFSVATRVLLEDVNVGRGQGFLVEGRLLTAVEHPLVGEFVTIDLPWNESRQSRVAGGGVFSQEFVVPSEQPLGVFGFNATYLGSANETFGDSTTVAVLEVGAPAVLEAEPLGELRRGNTTVRARLVDAETGDPIGGVPVTATASFGGDVLSALTDDDGRVRMQLSISRDLDPGEINVSFVFDGDERYAPVEAEASGVLRVPARLVLSVPGELGRGTQHVFKAVLTDDRGMPLSGRTLEIEALGLTWNVTTDRGGGANATFDLPLDASLGKGEITGFWEGDKAHQRARVSRGVEVKDGVLVHVDGVPDAVHPGDRITLGIMVEDTAGGPVQTPVVVRIDQVPGSMIVETDEMGRADLPFVIPDGLTNSFRLSVRFPGTDELAARTEVFEPQFVAASAEPVGQSARLWFVLTAGVSAAGVAGAAAFLVVRYKRGNRIAEILEGSRKRIEAGDPWTGAVLLAYQQLVEHLHDHGVEDADAGTPRAFVQHLVDTGVMGQDAAAQLVSLFERARYAEEGGLSTEDAIQARRILEKTVQSAQRVESIRERLVET